MRLEGVADFHGDLYPELVLGYKPQTGLKKTKALSVYPNLATV